MTRPQALLLLTLSACTPTAPVDIGQVPPGTFAAAGADQMVPAAEFAKWAFDSPSHTRGNLGAGIGAVMALEYEAGQFNTDPRWAQVGPLTRMQLLQGRRAVRQAVGIAPDAPAQLVIDTLLTARRAAASGDADALHAALANPLFTNGPAATAAILTDLPYIAAANVATMHATGQLLGPGAGDPLYRD